MADDYTFPGVSGKMSNRADALDIMRKDFADVKYKVLSATSDNLKVKVAGNMAFVKGNWTWTSTPANAAANAEPHKDTGRFTQHLRKTRRKMDARCRTLVGSPSRPQVDGTASFENGSGICAVIKNADAARNRNAARRRISIHRQ